MLNIIKNYKFLSNQDKININLLKNQGSCNLSHIIITNKEKYILKKNNQPIYNNVSKNFEFKIQNLSFKKGISAKPILCDHNNQIFISEFIEGHHKNRINLMDISNLAKILLKLHSIKISQKPFSIKRYFQQHNKTFNPKLKRVLLESYKYKKEFAICHNDLNPQNIIFGGSIKLIDFEFACVNDIYFDLASICVEFNLNTREEFALLNSYFKNKPNIKKLKCYKILYQQVCKTWFGIID